MWVTKYGIAKKEINDDKIVYRYLDGTVTVFADKDIGYFKSLVLTKQTKMMPAKDMKDWFAKNG